MTTYINRITVEFKITLFLFSSALSNILIESQWNLKLSSLKVYISNFDINRITVEFKIIDHIQCTVNALEY